MAGTMPGPVVRRAIEDIHSIAEHGCADGVDRLPSERDLAQRLRISRSTVRSALAYMREAGELEVRRGCNGGAFVVDLGRLDESLGPLTSTPGQGGPTLREAGTAESFSNVLASQGRGCSTQVVRKALETCPVEVGEQLGLDEPKELFHIERVRSIDGVPATYEQTYIDPELFPHFLELDLTRSIYDLLRDECGVQMGEVSEQADVISATPRCAQLLGLDEKHPLLRIMLEARDVDDRVVVISNDAYRPDAVRITVTNRIQTDQGGQG